MARRRTALVMVAVAAAAGAAFAVAGLLRGEATRPAGPPDVGSSGAPAGSFDPDYWTPERMRSAKPAPGPTIP